MHTQYFDINELEMLQQRMLWQHGGEFTRFPFLEDDSIRNSDRNFAQCSERYHHRRGVNVSRVNTDE